MLSARCGAKCGRRPRAGRYPGRIRRWRVSSISNQSAAGAGTAAQTGCSDGCGERSRRVAAESSKGPAEGSAGVNPVHLDAVVKPYGEGKENKAIAGSRERNLTLALHKSRKRLCRRTVGPGGLPAPLRQSLHPGRRQRHDRQHSGGRHLGGQNHEPRQLRGAIQPAADSRHRRRCARRAGTSSDYASARGPKAIAMHPWGLLVHRDRQQPIRPLPRRRP